MSAEYSAEKWTPDEVRAHRDAWFKKHTQGYELLTMLAERIEADERAVPVAKIRHFHYSGIARNGLCQEAQMLDGAPELPDGTELFTHPPAQAAQVDAWQIVCDSIRAHQFSDDHNRGRLTIDVERLLNEINNRRKAAEPVAHGEGETTSRLIEMCGDAWQSMNAYTDQFDKGSKSVASVEVSAFDLVNWCQVIAMASRGLRCLSTQPHSPDAADSGWVSEAMVEQACIAASDQYDDGTSWDSTSEKEKGYARNRMRRAITTALAAQGQGEAKPAGFGIACTVTWTELFDAMTDDGMSPPNKCGPATRKWIEQVVRDYLLCPPASPAGVPDQVRFAIERCLRSQEALVASIDKANPGDPYASVLVAEGIEYLRAWLAAAPSAPEGGEVGL